MALLTTNIYDIEENQKDIFLEPINLAEETEKFVVVGICIASLFGSGHTVHGIFIVSDVA